MLCGSGTGTEAGHQVRQALQGAEPSRLIFGISRNILVLLNRGDERISTGTNKHDKRVEARILHKLLNFIN